MPCSGVVVPQHIGPFFGVKMSGFERTSQQHVIREAEGYLELLMVFSDQYQPAPEIRDRLAWRAQRALEKAEVPDQESAYILYLQGQTLRCLEQYPDAVRTLRESANKDPANIHVWLALGWCYKRIGRLDLAIESLEDALTVDAHDGLVHYNLACYWSLVNNSNHALHHLGMALDINSNYREFLSHESDFDPIRADPAFYMLTCAIV